MSTKDNRITFRLSQEDRRLIESRAKSKGLNTSTLLRNMTIQRIKAQKQMDDLLFNRTKNFDR